MTNIKEHNNTERVEADRIHFKYDFRKSTQALDYFALRAGGRINKMKALKLIYLADRYHLRKYGRLITNDNYVAMKHGPVPSATKDIAELNDFLESAIKDYSLEYIKPVDNLVLKSVAKVDKKVLSDSDLEALQFAWETFGHLNQFELRDLTHLYPEWQKCKEVLVYESCMSMDVIDFFEDPANDTEKCFELSAKDKAIRKEQLAEISHIESLWS